MEITTAFISYIIFRLAIIAAGVVCIIIGYRLFCRGVWPDIGSGKESDLMVESRDIRFTLKNAAPGTFFALFGVVIISIMLVSSVLEFEKSSELKSRKQAGESISDTSLTESFILKTRSGEIQRLSVAIENAEYFKNLNDTSNAISAYEEAIAIIAVHINNLARLYFEQGKIDKALPLAQVAVQLAPDNAKILDTHAEISYKIKNYSEALRFIEKASSLDSTYRSKLPRFRQAYSNRVLHKEKYIDR